MRVFKNKLYKNAHVPLLWSSSRDCGALSGPLPSPSGGLGLGAGSAPGSDNQLLLHLYPGAWPLPQKQALHLCVAWLVWLIWKRRRLWIFQGVQQPSASLIPRLRHKLFQSFQVSGLAERKFAIWRDFLGVIDDDGAFV